MQTDLFTRGTNKFYQQQQQHKRDGITNTTIEKKEKKHRRNSSSSDNGQQGHDWLATSIRQAGPATTTTTERFSIIEQRYCSKHSAATRARHEHYSHLFGEEKAKDHSNRYQREARHNSPFFKSTKWIWLRFCINKHTELVFIDSRHFNTVQDILDRFNMKSCILNLYNEHERQMHPQEMVSEMRKYIVKRQPKH